MATSSVLAPKARSHVLDHAVRHVQEQLAGVVHLVLLAGHGAPGSREVFHQVNRSTRAGARIIASPTDEPPPTGTLRRTDGPCVLLESTAPPGPSARRSLLAALAPGACWWPARRGRRSPGGGIRAGAGGPDRRAARRCCARCRPGRWPDEGGVAGRPGLRLRPARPPGRRPRPCWWRWPWTGSDGVAEARPARPGEAPPPGGRGGSTAAGRSTSAWPPSPASPATTTGGWCCASRSTSPPATSTRPTSPSASALPCDARRPGPLRPPPRASARRPSPATCARRAGDRLRLARAAALVDGGAPDHAAHRRHPAARRRSRGRTARWPPS